LASYYSYSDLSFLFFFVLSNRDAFKRNIFNAKIKISMVPLLRDVFPRVV